MSNHSYVNFITDDHLLECIGELHAAYVRAKESLTEKKFYKNKIDIIKLRFDKEFNNLNEEELINFEISRQIDKSVNNAIGTFHENILGGISGFEKGDFSGFDIKAADDTLFADIKNKHNTMNSSSAESLFQKLARYADDYKNATCYWVQILATDSFNEKWFSIINGKEYSHSRVRKISGDQFYYLLTGEKESLFNLTKALKTAIPDYLASLDNLELSKKSAEKEIRIKAKKSNRKLLDQITYDNYAYYFGFDSL